MNWLQLSLGCLLVFWPLCVLIGMYGNCVEDRKVFDGEVFVGAIFASIMITVSVIGVVICWRSF